MSLSLCCARATITKLTVDKKAEDDGSKVVATALKIEVKTSADILAEFHPTLRSALFIRDGGVRFRSMKEIGWEGTRRHVELAMRPGPDMKPAVRLSEVTLRDFKLKPIEEGAQQLIALRFVADLEDPATPVSRILEYLKEEVWIDVHGGGELDLAPPSARTEIEELQGAAPPTEPTAPPAAPQVRIDSVRRLQPTRKGAREKLASYPNEVLQAAIAAEEAAADARPLFIEIITAELDRRGKATQPEPSP